VRIYVNSVNDPPIALDQNLRTFMNEALALELVFEDDGGGISISASGQNNIAHNDPHDSEYTFFIQSSPNHGSLEGTPPFLIYMPESDYLGTDQFTFKVSDGEYESNDATITITITNKYTIYLPILCK